jgi:putative ABC transport system permease protein
VAWVRVHEAHLVSEAVLAIQRTGAQLLQMTPVRTSLEQIFVQEVSPRVDLLLDDEYVSIIPPSVISLAPGSLGYEDMAFVSGRSWEPGERGVVVVGADLARRDRPSGGDSIDVREEGFEVIGILERTYVNLLDSAVYIPLADAQQLYYDSLPEAFRQDVSPDDLVLQADVFAEPGVDPDALAEDLEQNIDGIRASGPAQMLETADTLVPLMNAVVVSLSAIALLIGGLSIVNTMSMAVTERTHEIGVKRALGASRGRIARDVLFESAAIGGLGGIGGVVTGVLAALALNSAMIAATGTSALLPTVRLVVIGMTLAVVLGAVGGLYPARYASRMDPATTLAQH